MTTRKEALIALRDKVRDGDDLCFGDVDLFTQCPDCPYWILRAYYSHSLDAALALHEAVLPEVGWTLTDDGRCRLWAKDVAPQILVDFQSSTTTARAMLLADLEALIAEEDQ